MAWWLGLEPYWISSMQRDNCVYDCSERGLEPYWISSMQRDNRHICSVIVGFEPYWISSMHRMRGTRTTKIHGLEPYWISSTQKWLYKQKDGDLRMVYGYCRTSTPKQNIERQVRNIQKVYPEAFIVREAYTGTKIARDEFSKLIKRVNAGDTIVFDEVSRMARNEEEGYELWMELFKNGVHLVFLKEKHISTSVYAQRLDSCKLQLTGTSVDIILQAVEQFLFELAKEQIRLAFHQAQKEVDFLHQRTKEGIQTAKLNNKKVGRVAGKVYVTKKARESKAIIKKHNKDFGGTLNDRETMALCGVRPNAFYKYKKQLKEDNV